MKKREDPPPVPMSEMKLIDWYAGMALMECGYQTPEAAAVYAMDRAEAMMKERAKRGL